ncbi:MAG TPA: ABC transporter permease [candidate division Zixibacteria bacterium]|nr:ABC transporter permease [candidate division Zixibacteria bacterium]
MTVSVQHLRPQAHAQPGTLRANLRLFWLGGLISYRALFNWARPSIYIPTLIGAPTFQILFFAALGSYATGMDPEFFAVGNAVQVSAMSGIYGMTMAIANERWFGTLHALLATPASRWAIFGGRFVPFIVNGLLVSVYGFAISWIFLGVDIPPAGLGVIALALLVTVFSCSAIGAVQGGLSMRLRDGLFGANLLVFMFLLFCGVNIPLETLPGWMQAVSQVLPFTHGLQAVRAAVDGAGLDQVGGLILVEFGIGAAYALLAFGLFSYLERSARANATLDVR